MAGGGCEPADWTWSGPVGGVDPCFCRIVGRGPSPTEETLTTTSVTDRTGGDFSWCGSGRFATFDRRPVGTGCFDGEAGSWPVTVAVTGIGLITPTGLLSGGLVVLNRRNWPRTLSCDRWWRRNSESGGLPKQVVLWLKRSYPDSLEMRVSHETIYLSLFVQGKGALRRELTDCLRTGRAYRRPKTKRAPSGKGRIVDPVMISEHPAEVEDRAVPGHWEGDLLMGRRQTAIGTLVERHTRYVMLFPSSRREHRRSRPHRPRRHRSTAPRTAVEVVDLGSG